jgi:choline-sulfatase
MIQQNIVLITIDCLRYDRCGFNGHDRNTTPVLDSLATESFAFDEAYASGPYTPESFPGLLAGLHDRDVSHYSDLLWKAIPGEAPTIAAHLRDQGYETLATITNPHLTTTRNFDRGFTRFRNLRDEREAGFTTVEREHDENGLTNAAYYLLTRLRNEAREGGNGAFRPLYVLYRLRQLYDEWPSKRAATVIDAFLSDLDTAKLSGDPFFAWTHLMDLHVPIHPAVVTESDPSPLGGSLRPLVWDSARLTNRENPNYDRLYEAALRYVDAAIGRIVSHLEQMGEWENTILIVTSDHGEALFDRGVYGHPFHYLFDELLRVPLLVRTPSEDAARINQPFSLAWMHELLAELTGVEPFDLPARSGRSSHVDDPTEDVLVVSDSISTDGHTVAVRDGKCKCIEHYGSNPYDRDPLRELVSPYRDGVLYYTDADRGERCPQAPSMAAAPLLETAAWFRTPPEDVPSIAGRIDESTEERLRDLGYAA